MWPALAPVQKPPSASHTRTPASADPVATRPPDGSTAIAVMGDRWVDRHARRRAAAGGSASDAGAEVDASLRRNAQIVRDRDATYRRPSAGPAARAVTGSES